MQFSLTVSGNNLPDERATECDAKEAQRGVREGDAGGGGDGSGSGVQRLQPSNLSARRQGLQSWGKGGGGSWLWRESSQQV